MSIYNSPGSSNNDHIRHLLYQRTAPSHIHTHFSSPSNVSDSPSSIYSHTQFTPRPTDHHQGPYYSPRSDGSPRSPVFDREGPNHADQTSLDLDNDNRTSYLSNNSSSQDRSSYVIDQDDEPENRMSMLGIKMRFHSKAPWETGEDDIVEEDEPENSSIHRPSSHSKRSLRSFGNGSRPSDDSSRSFGKKSFETSSSQMSSRGALQALAQASMLTSSPTPPLLGQSGLRQKLSLPRIRTRTMSNSNTSVSSHPYSTGSASPRSVAPSFLQASPIDTRPISPTKSEYSQAHLDTRSIISRSPSPVGHPYANPELVRSFIRSSNHHSVDSQGEGPRTVNSSDSLATLMSSMPTSGSMDNYPASVYSTHSTHSAHSPHFSVPKDRSGSREVSPPVRLSPSAPQPNTNSDGKWRETRVFPVSTGNGIAGWQESQPSTFTLISLEEARAQRIRTVTMQSGSSTGSRFDVAFPASDQVHASAGPSVLARTRGRSISGSEKSKQGESIRSNFFAGKHEPATTDGSSGGKSLKHKKSGFMKMFGKEKDRAPMPSPPPHSFPDTIPPVPRTPKVSTHRVPVPPLSPRLDVQDNISPKSHDSHDDRTVGGHAIEQASMLDRIMPSLSINTSSSAKQLFGTTQYPPASDGLQPSVVLLSASASGERQPQSAPPATTDFLGLKLRPVSTMFSSQFSDHLLDPEGSSERGSEPSLDMDEGTSSTTTYSGNTSPLSPDSSHHTLSRLGLDKLNPALSQDDSQLKVVHALQTQISGAKQAWQRHIWELEGQVRDLKAEIEELKHAEGGGDYCSSCGRGDRRTLREGAKVGVIRRPRAHTAVSPRFGNTLET